jgi:tyrosine-protein phosphatase SIW14
LFSTGAMFLFTVTLPLTAAPTEQSAAGVGHFFKVDNRLYRGAQPSEEGFESLARLGIKTVVDLRETSERSDWEQSLVEKSGMKYVAFPIGGLAAPSDTQIHQILSIINDPSQGPVFVHCQRGKDRTGAVVACYRIQHDGWTNAKALKEARNLGMSWFELPKQQFVMAFRPEGNLPSAGEVPVVPATVIVPAR